MAGAGGSQYGLPERFQDFRDFGELFPRRVDMTQQFSDFVTIRAAHTSGQVAHECSIAICVSSGCALSL